MEIEWCGRRRPCKVVSCLSAPPRSNDKRLAARMLSCPTRVWFKGKLQAESRAWETSPKRKRGDGLASSLARRAGISFNRAKYKEVSECTQPRQRALFRFGIACVSGPGIHRTISERGRSREWQVLLLSAGKILAKLVAVGVKLLAVGLDLGPLGARRLPVLLERLQVLLQRTGVARRDVGADLLPIGLHFLPIAAQLPVVVSQRLAFADQILEVLLGRRTFSAAGRPFAAAG